MVGTDLKYVYLPYIYRLGNRDFHNLKFPGRVLTHLFFKALKESSLSKIHPIYRLNKLETQVST